MLDLVVRTDVCVGVCKTGGFPRLKYLKIGWFSLRRDGRRAGQRAACRAAGAASAAYGGW